MFDSLIDRPVLFVALKISPAKSLLVCEDIRLVFEKYLNMALKHWAVTCTKCAIWSDDLLLANRHLRSHLITLS